MCKKFKEVKLRSCVILGEVVSVEGTGEFLGEDFVFNYVFRYFVGIVSDNRFRANTPGNRGMVTKTFYVEFRGVIMHSGFVGTGGVNRRRGRGPDTIEEGEGELGDVEMCILSGDDFCEFVQCFVPVFAVWVLWGRWGEYFGVDVGGSNAVWFKNRNFGGIRR